MAVNALLAMGAQLYDSPDGTTFTELVDMESIGPPDDPTINFVDVTPVNPTARAHEFLPGLIKYGEFEFKQFYTATRFTHLRSLLSTAANVKTWWKVTLNDAVTTVKSMLVFSGYLVVAKWSPLDTEKPVTIDCKAQITGASTFTPAS